MSPVTALRRVHSLQQQLSEVRHRLQRGPAQMRAGEAAVQDIERQLAEAKQRLTRTRVAADEKQLQLRSREQRIEQMKLQLNSCGSNREFQALKEQIAADLEANNVLADEILEALERIDQIQEEMGRLEQQLGRARQELEQARKRVADESGKLENEIGRLEQELEQAIAALPMDARAEYQRLVRVRGDDALAAVENGCCSACFHTVTPQTMNELLTGKIVLCKSCGALLYLPEETP